MKMLQRMNLAALLLASVSLAAFAQAPMAGMEQHTRPKGVASISLSVTVAGKATTYSVADLQAMPQKTVSVHNAHSNTDQVYTGVVLTDLLVKAGGEVGKPLLRTYIKAAGTDAYWVLYSGIEVEAASHLGDVIVATALDGKPLAESGAFMLVATEDKKPQRWVRNLTALTVVKPE